jgi:hypothetical protein
MWVLERYKLKQLKQRTEFKKVESVFQNLFLLTISIINWVYMYVATIDGGL